MGNSVASNVKAEDMVDYVPQYADLLKDEVNWPIGKWGYYEPPMSLREQITDPVLLRLSPESKNDYILPIYSEKYGNLEMYYDPQNGQRTF